MKTQTLKQVFKEHDALKVVVSKRKCSKNPMYHSAGHGQKTKAGQAIQRSEKAWRWQKDAFPQVLVGLKAWVEVQRSYGHTILHHNFMAQ